jgi:hypothetical protein
MKVLVRQIQKIRPDKWPELEEFEAFFSPIEEGYGRPPKKRYKYVSGAHPLDMLVLEVEWESFSVWEAYVEKLMADPAWLDNTKRFNEVVEKQWIEYLLVLD